jgi:uncharacterized surface protein with fasciclin (FAS1) repeats
MTVTERRENPSRADVIVHPPATCIFRQKGPYLRRHVDINEGLMTPSRIVYAIAAFLFTAQAAHAANIVQTAQSAGTFKTLLAAAQAAGLVNALSGGGPITVFAPDDAAFAKLPKGTVASLLKPENKDKLKAILTYHVVPGAVAAADVPTRATKVATLNGEKLVVRRRGSAVHVGGARVTAADIKADNGVIHVINKVLLPK